MSGSKVSVIVPAYNAVRTIASTLRSIAAQTLEEFELIVVDDGSTDDTAALVEETWGDDSRLRLIRQENGGTASARNTGLREAGGEFVSFLDNDDLWMPRYLERMTEALEEHPSAGLSYTDAWVLDDRTKRIRAQTSLEYFPTVARDAPASSVLKALLKVNFIMSSVTARRQAIVEAGGFDPSLSGVDDYDLWLRIVSAGHTAVRPEGTFLIQRDRPDSQSKNELMIIEGHLEALRRAQGRLDLDDDAQRALEGELRRFGRWEKALRGEDRTAAALYRARSLFSRLRNRLGRETKWPPSPPAEVAQAFPDLESL